MKKIRKITILIAVILAILIIITVNNYREKGLDDVISYDIANFNYLIINGDLKTDKKEYAKGLKKLLGQYRVKKMKDREWDSDVSKEKGVSITIYIKDKPIMASIYEYRVVFYNDGDYYKVINGPINMDWVDKMYNEVGQ